MLYFQHIICIFATYNLNLCAIYLYLQYIIFYLQYIQGPTNKMLGVQITGVYVSGMSNNYTFGHEMGRRGSPRAHTLGKWSYGAKYHFKIGFGTQN